MTTQGRAYSILGSFVLAALGACTTQVRSYSPDYLLPKGWADSLRNTSKVGLSTANFCTGFQKEWDSILVVKPYTRPSIIQSLRIENYSAIESVVKVQSISDGTCTLLFVKGSRYVGHSLFPRTLDLSTIGKSNPTQLVWITARDCGKIFIKKDSLDPKRNILAYTL